MVKRIAITVASILGLLFVGLVVFFTIAVVTSEGSAACTLPSGRSIAASARLYISLEGGKDTATIRTFPHTIVVAPTRITVDGQLFGTIPADAENVRIRVGWTEYEVVADGAVVGKAQTATAGKGTRRLR